MRGWSKRIILAPRLSPGPTMRYNARENQGCLTVEWFSKLMKCRNHFISNHLRISSTSLLGDCTTVVSSYNAALQGLTLRMIHRTTKPASTPQPYQLQIEAT